MKVNIQFFDGQLRIKEFLDLLNIVETFFEYMNVSEEKKVKLVAYKLKYGATAW